jgi:hypothetical protein
MPAGCFQKSARDDARNSEYRQLAKAAQSIPRLKMRRPFSMALCAKKPP